MLTKYKFSLYSVDVIVLQADADNITNSKSYKSIDGNRKYANQYDCLPMIGLYGFFARDPFRPAWNEVRSHLVARSIRSSGDAPRQVENYNSFDKL